MGPSPKVLGHSGGEQNARSSAGTVRNGHEGVFSRDASTHVDRPIREVESKLMNLADFQPQPVWVVAPDGSADYFNLYWERFTGLSEEESLHFGWIRALHADDVDAFLKQLRNAADHGFEFEVRLKGAGEGRYRRHLCRSSLLPNGSERLAKLLISCVDVEDWRSFRDAAQEQAALLGFSLRAYDEERRKTAHAIHDSAGQYLIALQMKLDGLQRGSENGAGKSPFVDECRELVKRCSRELRAISYLLHPPLLDDLGLESAVRFHVDSFVERTKIKVELDIEPNLGRLDRDLEIALFRVVQEALTNVNRQDAGQSARIKISASSSNVHVEVEASAGMTSLRGTFPASPRSSSGLGIAITRERIRQIGGTFEVSSSPGIMIRAVVPRRALVAHACD
jgi:signal transduction histidine kinase